MAAAAASLYIAERMIRGETNRGLICRRLTRTGRMFMVNNMLLTEIFWTLKSLTNERQLTSDECVKISTFRVHISLKYIVILIVCATIRICKCKIYMWMSITIPWVIITDKKSSSKSCSSTFGLSQSRQHEGNGTRLSHRYMLRVDRYNHVSSNNNTLY